MKRLCSLVTAAVLPLLLGMPGAWGAWEVLDGPLNDGSAFAASTAVRDGAPAVAFSDPDVSGNGGIYVKRFDGSAWNHVGANPINATGEYESANAPSLAVSGDGSLYVAWRQDHNDVPVTRQVFVQRYDGSGWADVGSNPLNADPANAAGAPRIAVDGSGNAYVAWHEDDGAGVAQIFVKKYDGVDWELLGGGPINEDPAHGARLAAVALDGTGRPYVAWQEEDDSDPPVYQVFVKRFDGTAWDLVGTDNPLNLNPAQNAYTPRIAFNGSVPYVTWAEQDPAQDLKTQIHVKRFDSLLGQWEFVGGASSLNVSANQSAVDPSLAFDPSGNPFVVWCEGTATFDDVVLGKKFDGSAWGLVARLNMGEAYLAETPEILFDDLDGLPYIQWLEEDAAFDYKVYVAKSTPTFTVLQTLAATPCAAEVCINVAWETDLEPENAGFHVWRRADLPGQEYVRITDALIPAEGSGSSGAAYLLVDSDVVQGQRYYYQVEDFNLTGQSTLHGPVSAVAPSGEEPPPPWGAASTLQGSEGVSGPLNALGLLLVLPFAAMLLLARVRLVHGKGAPRNG